MSDFLLRLAQRQLGQIASVEPRVPELYAPVTTVVPLLVVDDTPARETIMPRVSEPGKPFGEKTSTVDMPSAARITERPLEVNQGGNDGKRSLTKSDDEVIDVRSAERVRTEAAPLTAPKFPAQPYNVEVSASPNPITAKSVSPQVGFESRTPLGSTIHEAPLRLVTTQAMKAAAVPPRLEPQVSNSREVEARARESAAPEPPVQVTIGRIEVTAVTAAPTQRRAATPRKPAMSLDDYLARRQRGER
jgi:hypothetical protein